MEEAINDPEIMKRLPPFREQRRAGPQRVFVTERGQIRRHGPGNGKENLNCMSATRSGCAAWRTSSRTRGVRARARAQIAIFRLDDDSVYAIDNHDPFSGAKCSREVSLAISRRAGRGIARLQQHFSLVSGRCVEDAAVQIPVYTVSESRRASYS